MVSATSLLFMFISGFAWFQQLSLPVYRIDPSRSRIEVGVFRGGLLKAFGHDHKVAAREFSGMVLFDPARLSDSSVSLTVLSKSVSVLDPGASEKERSEVQATMEGLRVLNVQAFPEIGFVSTKVRNVTQTGSGFEIQLAGKLKIHGVEKETAFPVRINLGKDLLRATGTASVRQTDFGIVPVNLGAGTVRVKDEITVRFDFLAYKASE